TMAPSFHRSFAPPIPASFLNSYYVLAAAHAALGTLAELFALYILMVAGTNMLPKRLRFTRYGRWMRASLVLWWTTLLLELATYVRWYLGPVLSALSLSRGFPAFSQQFRSTCRQDLSRRSGASHGSADGRVVHCPRSLGCDGVNAHPFQLGRLLDRCRYRLEQEPIPQTSNPVAATAV